MPDVPQWEDGLEHDEGFEVERRRYREARTAGLTMVEAQMFSQSDIDIGLLRALVAGKCPLKQLVEILL